MTQCWLTVGTVCDAALRLSQHWWMSRIYWMESTTMAQHKANNGWVCLSRCLVVLLLTYTVIQIWSPGGVFVAPYSPLVDVLLASDVRKLIVLMATIREKITVYTRWRWLLYFHIFQEMFYVLTADHCEIK